MSEHVFVREAAVLWIKRIVLGVFLLVSIPFLMGLFYLNHVMLSIVFGVIWAAIFGGLCWWVFRGTKSTKPKPERYQMKNRHGEIIDSVDPELEDPEVFEYFADKAWPYSERDDVYYRDVLLNSLRIQNSAQPYQLLDLTAEDFRMIGRAKALQTLCLDLDPLNNEALQLISKAPQLRFLKARLYEVTDVGIQALARAKKLNGLMLSHAPNVSETAWHQLLSNRPLTAICFERCRMTGACFTAFRVCESLYRVQLINLEGLTDQIFETLSTLPNLKTFQLYVRDSKHHITSAGLARFLLTRLPERLELEQQLIDDRVLQALVKAGWLYGPHGVDFMTGRPKPRNAAEVQDLSFYDTKITDAGFSLIENCTNATNLMLHETGVTDVSIRKIANFKKLKYLGLSQLKISPRALLELISLPVQQIEYCEAPLVEDHFKVLCQFQELEDLQLYDSEYEFAWLHYLRRSPRLQKLDLSGAHLKPGEVAILTKLPHLREIVLDETNLDDAGFRLLAKLPQLTKLSAVDSEVSPECCAQLKRQRPEVQFVAGERDYGMPPPF